MGAVLCLKGSSVWVQVKVDLLQALLSLFPPAHPRPPFWASTPTRLTLVVGWLVAMKLLW